MGQRGGELLGAGACPAQLCRHQPARWPATHPACCCAISCVARGWKEVAAPFGCSTACCSANPSPSLLSLMSLQDDGEEEEEGDEEWVTDDGEDEEEDAAGQPVTGSPAQQQLQQQGAPGEAGEAAGRAGLAAEDGAAAGDAT